MAPVTGLELRVDDLSLSYDGSAVLKDISFGVAPREVVALVGPNGTGKTSLLRCVVGTLAPDSGTVTLGGRTLDERRPWTRRAVAAVLDDADFFPDLTAREHLDLLARAHGTPDPVGTVDEALRRLDLEMVADRLPRTFSSGQRRRLALATTCVRRFDLLVMDEPEQRLDARGRRWLGGYLRAVAHVGGSVLIASHDDALVGEVGARVIPMPSA